MQPLLFFKDERYCKKFVCWWEWVNISIRERAREGRTRREERTEGEGHWWCAWPCMGAGHLLHLRMGRDSGPWAGGSEDLVVVR